MAEEKGSNQTGAELAALDVDVPAGGRKPAESPGRIVFHCGNGHRIIVPEELAGKRAKCSKCGVAVSIPRAGPPAGEPPQTTGAGASPEPATEAVADPEESPGAGVHLAGSEERGKPDGAAESQADMFSGIAAAIEGPESPAGFVELSGIDQQAASGIRSQSSAGPAHASAMLVARLFEEMQQGGIVELHLEGGSVILPEFYDHRWSTESLGLFASRAADGTVTLTAVAWQVIQKIVVRQVEGLPDGMFE